MLLLKNADVYTPAAIGRADILLAGGRIVMVGPDIEVPARLCERVDASGLVAAPGFIDGHVHLAGAGGEGGFATRTPELAFSDAVRGGITTVVGCLGTDGATRSPAGLLAKARALDEEGLSTFVLTGHYAVPVQTLTGSIERDLLLIDKVVGVGEVAISDHRSTQPTFEQFVRVAAEARRGGMLSGKAGVVNVHVGDGPRGLSMLRRAVEETEIPATQFWPTHINRNPALFDEGQAWAKAGGVVDFTTSTVPAFLDAGEVRCGAGLRRMLEAGVDASRVTFTSDGQGSLPDYDAAGELRGLRVGRVTSLAASVRDAVLVEGVPLATALLAVTANPARILKLRGKGALGAGADADLVLLDPAGLEIDGVIAKGRWLMKGREIVVRGTFE
ncbi:MAG TPA: beta-aspartyl-peptidase [Vicinamibacterales bacterium]|nr:beta-aspartyl-peptidase [Vicinamibacterales bacterium]HPK72007.1 beta-aspartyl-peptidase [Vicinamibacterales bacterium]